jgi:methylthioribose-1-phosphate isomerase
MTYPLRTIQEDGDAVVILDQTRLPAETVFVKLQKLEDAARAIRDMQVRGAPLIGAAAAYGVALGLKPGGGDARLAEVVEVLGATRPTAVNLHWALARMRSALAPLTVTQRPEAAWREARAIAAEDEAANAAIGRHGLPLIAAIAEKKRSRVNLMTHCNAGWLATVAHGTALAPIYAAHAAGIELHVWVSETRPRNQGLLTAWELRQAGIPHTLIADNAAGLLMMQGKVDAVIVGADRIAANGDTANKVGTYLKALAAKAHGVPFYVAAPMSTVDFCCGAGKGIPIEDRSTAELGYNADLCNSAMVNPAFDVTPANLIAGLICELGIDLPSSL